MAGGGVAGSSLQDQGLPSTKLITRLVSKVVRELVRVLMTFLMRQLMRSLMTPRTTFVMTSVAGAAGSFAPSSKSA